MGGRRVRKVPPGWEHPRDAYGNFIPLLGGSWLRALERWEAERAKWEAGEFPEYADAEARAMSYGEWSGPQPQPSDYMPEWSPEEATHLMMYETTSEGTPISPVFATLEDLARWLADNGASRYGGLTATYEEWLRVARGGCAPSAVAGDGQMHSGVEGLTEASASDEGRG